MSYPSMVSGQIGTGMIYSYLPLTSRARFTNYHLGVRNDSDTILIGPVGVKKICVI